MAPSVVVPAIGWVHTAKSLTTSVRRFAAAWVKTHLTSASVARKGGIRFRHSETRCLPPGPSRAGQGFPVSAKESERLPTLDMNC